MTNKKTAPRIRFNWGYWDGRSDFANGRPAAWASPHFDKAYEAGYWAGKSSCSDADSSAPAWAEHKAG